jgi:hypothetical protein
MADCGRRMVERNIEGSEMLEMNVLLRVVTTLEVEEDQFDQYRYSYNYGQNVGLSMTLYDEALSSNFKGSCTICFEEFCNGSYLKPFYTNCSHIFHKIVLPSGFMDASIVHLLILVRCVVLKYYEK